jgi:DNA polymerase-3 subunit epsilon
VAVGFVPVQGCRVVLSGAGQFVVRPPGAVGQSATFHGLTDDVVAEGSQLEEVLGVLLRALRGRVLLAHHAELEQEFLSAACERLFGSPLPCVVVDTMALEGRLTRHRWPQEPPPGSMRLGAARERHGLPRYRAHDALTDAVACAELYLAQVAELGGNRLLLRDLAG